VGKGGVNALKEFLDNPLLDLKPVGFIDDDLRNQGKQVNGYPVLGTIDSLEKILEKNSVSEMIVTSDHIPKEKLERLSQICSSRQITLRRFQTRLEDIPT
jgi:FlaA1/EpsC-like NDP-sugar epimerase